MTCRIRGCGRDRHPGEEWCSTHLRRLIEDMAWGPVKVGTGEWAGHLLCSFCARPVSYLLRVDDDSRVRHLIDMTSSPEGRCVIRGGGFEVLREGSMERRDLPTYRTHPPICEGRERFRGLVIAPGLL